jgi:hypothetical protein
LETAEPLFVLARFHPAQSAIASGWLSPATILTTSASVIFRREFGGKRDPHPNRSPNLVNNLGRKICTSSWFIGFRRNALVQVCRNLYLPNQK